MRMREYQLEVSSQILELLILINFPVLIHPAFHNLISSSPLPFPFLSISSHWSLNPLPSHPFFYFRFLSFVTLFLQMGGNFPSLSSSSSAKTSSTLISISGSTSTTPSPKINTPTALIWGRGTPVAIPGPVIAPAEKKSGERGNKKGISLLSTCR